MSELGGSSIPAAVVVRIFMCLPSPLARPSGQRTELRSVR